ncbi:phage tail family protein [Actinomadura sp. ATCC 31491]|uniref:Phage tail family protein n=1 Tax=Actinomadura luzonensis TaxID=2805427 RepID=A0ABT0FPP3_9ACTN|nr:phage tail family protein [Actinomadura luzonensis]MCK2214299.1 phage tail family protein [Actinomadura luzonensis]
MARLGRSQPIPVKSLGKLRYSRATIDLPAFEVSAEWPDLSIVTPNVNLNLPVFEITAEWPALSLTRDQILTLPVFEVTAEWPALTISIPPSPGDAMTGADGEIEWNGPLARLVAGGGQDLYRITELEGWEDLPGVESGNTSRPSRHGSYAGRKYGEERVVTATIQIDDNSPTFAESLAFLRQATAIGDSDDEYPLVIRLRGETLLAFGAITGRIMPTGLVGAGIVQASIRWTCSDPRRYSLGLQGTNISLNTPTALANTGNCETHPLIRLPGPVTDPVLVNAELGQSLGFDLEVPDGSTLEIDTDGATVTMGGVSQALQLTTASVQLGDFVLAAATNTITYSAGAGGSAGADFLWRHAHL